MHMWSFRSRIYRHAFSCKCFCGPYSAATASSVHITLGRILWIYTHWIEHHNRAIPEQPFVASFEFQTHLQKHKHALIVILCAKIARLEMLHTIGGLPRKCYISYVYNILRAIHNILLLLFETLNTDNDGLLAQLLCVYYIHVSRESCAIKHVRKSANSASKMLCDCISMYWRIYEE